MNMHQIVVESGKTLLEEVPTPRVENGTVLLNVLYSSISQGTEIAISPF